MKAIRRRRLMLDGVCAEAIELLKDKSVNPKAFEILRKMRPLRQIEAAELMTTAGNYTSSYAGALLAATKQADLVKSESPKSVAGLTADQMARMEREMEALQHLRDHPSQWPGRARNPRDGGFAVRTRGPARSATSHMIAGLAGCSVYAGPRGGRRP